MVRFLWLLRLLALRPLRRHPLRALLALLAVAAGTSMVVGVVVVRSSVEESVEEFGQVLAGPGELRVVGAMRRGGLEPGVADAVAAVDGVRSAVPMVQAVAMTGPAGTGAFDDERPVLALGVDCRVEALTGRFGCTDAVASDRGNLPLARGPGTAEDAVLRTNRGDVTLRDVPVLDAEGVGRLGDGRFVVFALPTAQRLFDRGEHHDVIYVEPHPGHDVDALKTELRRVVGAHNGVLDAADGPPEVAVALAETLPLFTLLALFGLGTGAMLVYNIVTLSVEQRRRESAVVGALGGSRPVVAGVTFGETLLLGLAGGLGGAVGGVLVARALIDSLGGYTERVAGIPLQVHAGPQSFLIGAVAGVTVAAAATVPAVRRALRVDVVAELTGGRPRREAVTARPVRRVVVRAVPAGLGLALVWLAQRDGGLAPWQHTVGGLGFGLAAPATVLFGAAVAALLISSLSRMAGGSAVGRLAFAGLAGSPGRTGVMVAALGAAAGTTFVTAGFGLGFSASLTQDVLDDMDGVRVSSVGSGANINVDAGIPPEVLAELDGIEGVHRVHRGAAVLTGSQPGEIVMVTASQEPWEAADGRPGVRGRLDLEGFERGEALISTALARRTGLRPGDTVALPTPGGMVHLPVQAVVHGGGTGDGRVTIAYDVHVDLYGVQPVRAVYVEAEPGTDPDDLAARLDAADLGADLRVETPADVVADARSSVARQMAPYRTLQQGLLAVAFVAVLSTMLLAGVQRTRELAVVAAVGGGPGTLVRVVLLEAVVVAGAAWLLAVGGGTVLLWAMSRLAPLTMGFPVPFAVDWWSVLPAGGSVVAVAVVAAVWPAWRAARTDILAVIRSE